MATLIYLSQIYSYYIRGDRSPLIAVLVLFSMHLKVRPILNKTTIAHTGVNIALQTQNAVSANLDKENKFRILALQGRIVTTVQRDAGCSLTL